MALLTAKTATTADPKEVAAPAMSRHEQHQSADRNTLMIDYAMPRDVTHYSFGESARMSRSRAANWCAPGWARR
jgi:hypothetical protein